MRSVFPKLLSIALLSLLLTKPAYAYIDPVTVTFVLQAIAGAIAAALAGIRSVRVRVLGFFSSLFAKKKAVDDN